MSTRPPGGEAARAASGADVEDASRTVMIVLPFQMSARLLLHTDVVRLMARERGIRWLMVTRDEADAALLERFDTTCFGWRELPRPFRAPGRRERRAGGSGGLRRWLGDARFVLGFYLHLMLVYRFNARRGFRGFLDRLQQSRRLRRLALKEGLALSPWLGFPFPRSERLYRVLHGLYHARWQRHPAVEAMLDAECPAALVLGHLQNPWVTPFALAATARGIPVVGINGSWDQPTTKGPLCPGIGAIAAQGLQVADELREHHDVPAERVELVGWPQMDLYRDAARATPRKAFLRRIGLPDGARYILVGAYSERLGSHEPEMCAALAEGARAGRFGPGVTLYVRPHPLDTRWIERLGHLRDPPRVVVEEPDLGDLDHLADLLRHAAVLIASAGTINLDAVAVDTPAIAVAFEDEREPWYDRPARRYDMEHYRPVVESGGVRLARDEGELMDLVEGYLGDRSRDADGRERLRERCLAPLDGRSAERLVAFLVRHCGAGRS